MRTPTQTILISLGLAALGLLAVLTYGLYKIRTQSTEVASLESRAASLGQMDNVAQIVRSIRNNWGADLSKLDSLIVSQKKVVAFIEMIENLGRDMELETHTISVNTDEATVRIALETDGSWGHSMSFVQALENLPYKVVLDEATLSTNSESRGWHTNIVLILPFFDN